MKTIAVIPARGGSKGIPNKNIKIIAGKPLIGWTIEHALNSKNVDKVYVSTDSDEIARIATKFGAKVPFLRPSHLAEDTTATEPVILHLLDWLKDNESFIPDNIVLLQCTSPIRASDAIDNAIDLFNANSCDSLLSVTPFWHFLWKNPASPNALYDHQNRPRRQDIKNDDTCYRENGSIYVTKEKCYRLFKNRLGGKMGMYIMSEEESYEIDNPIDWTVNEAILQASKERSA